MSYTSGLAYFTASTLFHVSYKPPPALKRPKAKQSISSLAREDDQKY